MSRITSPERDAALAKMRRRPAFRTLPPNYKRLFKYVAEREGAELGFFEGRKKTALALGLSEKTIRNGYSRLVELGFLTPPEHRYWPVTRNGGRPQTTNRYRVNLVTLGLADGVTTRSQLPPVLPPKDGRGDLEVSPLQSVQLVEAECASADAGAPHDTDLLTWVDWADWESAPPLDYITTNSPFATKDKAPC